MSGMLQINKDSKQVTKRIVVLALLICVISVALLSEAFVLSHMNHEHNHNGAGGACTTCVLIQNTENLLKQLGTALAVILFVPIGLFATIGTLHSVSPQTRLYTLVSLKIRLNN